MSIYIEEYSTKSFVVRGETLNVKEALKTLGGKWNSNLTDKKTDEKFGAWLFWTDKKKEVEDWLKNGVKHIPPKVDTSCCTTLDDILKKLKLMENRIAVLEARYEEDDGEIVKRLL